ncbi:MAG: DUF4435 domain-containing protein [Chloroflexota bacterium]|nr:DUF4435 domain-containing protein [Chloroflexota bacterium]
MALMDHSELVSEYILRGQARLPFVLVEGVTDRSLWLEYADCDPIPTQGKDQIIDALKSYMLREAKGVAGIIDLDYTLISQSYERDMPNLLYDDCCPDMESILLSSPALKKVLRHELMSKDIDVAAVHKFADALNQEAHRLAAEIGYFRWLNERECYRLNFKTLRIADFVGGNPLALDRNWLAKRLAEERDSISSRQLLDETTDLRENPPTDIIQLCRGKDVVAIMAHILPRVYQEHFDAELPTSAKTLMQAKQLAKELCKTYEYIYFTETSLFQRICDWQKANKPYRILRDF